MPWRIELSETPAEDLALFDDLDELTRCLMRWVESGPPGTLKRRAHAEGHEQGVPFYEDRTTEGILVQYFVGTQPDLYVAVLRLRPPPKPPLS